MNQIWAFQITPACHLLESEAVKLQNQSDFFNNLKQSWIFLNKPFNKYTFLLEIMAIHIWSSLFFSGIDFCLFSKWISTRKKVNEI